MNEPRTPRAATSATAQTIASAGDRARSFRQARRHSRLVRLMRLALPSLGLLMVGVYAATVLSVSTLKGTGVEVAQVRIDPKNLTMQSPKYDGFGTDGSRYVVRAREAITDLRQTGPIRLNVIDGEITQPSGVVTRLKAPWGTYDQKQDILELYERIEIDGSNGMKARLTRATVYPRESRVVSGEPVYAETETGNIRSQRMTLNSKTRQATFSEAVNVELKPNPAKAASEPKSGTVEQKGSTLMPGLAASSGQPIKVKSEQLDVDDNGKTALFRRDVIARQGESVLQAPELDVLYEGRAAIGDAPKGAAAAKDGAPAAEGEGQARLKTLKARGGVVLTSKDSRATGATLDHDAASSLSVLKGDVVVTNADGRATSDVLEYNQATERAVLHGNVVMTSSNERQVTAARAELDQKADTALVTGDVVVTQGKNVMKGRRLFVDRRAGKTRLESPAADGQPAGRIHSTLYQSQTPAKAAAAKDAPKADASESPLGALGASFKADPNAPIEIEAETLDVADQSKTAVYRGNVIAKQGEFVVQTVQLTAHYTGQASVAQAGQPAGKTSAKGEAAQGTQLTRVEARQRVVVTGKDGQKAVGEWADFDVKANTIVMGSKVVVSQGKNVVEGPEGTRFVIDMASGVSRFEQDPAAAKPAGAKAMPAVSATAAATDAATAAAAAAATAERPKPRMRAVFHSKEAEAAVKKKAAEGGEGKSGADAGGAKAAKDKTGSSAWEATTSAPIEKKR